MTFREYITEMDLGSAAKKMKQVKGNKELENLSKELKKLNYSDDIRHTVINTNENDIIIQFNAEEKDKSYLRDIEKTISKVMKNYEFKSSSVSRSLDKTGHTYYLKYTK